MVIEHHSEYSSQWEAISSNASILEHAGGTTWRTADGRELIRAKTEAVLSCA